MINKYPYTNFHELNLDWIIGKIKDLINSNNQLVEDMDALKTYVENYFANLDVSEEVNAKLDEMITDGTFVALVQQAINELIVRQQNLKLNRLMRYAMPTYAYDDDNTAQRKVNQGSCYTKNEQFIFATIDATQTVQNAELYEYNKTGNIIRSFTLPTGHTNSLAYDRVNNLLASNLTTIDLDAGTEVQESYINIYDYDTLTLVKTVPTVAYPNQIAFDENGNLYYAVKTAQALINIYDENNNMIVSGINIPTPSPYSAYTLAGFRVYNGLYYFQTHANSAIYIYSDDQLVHVWDLPTVTGEGFPIGEVEALDFDTSGNIYIFSTILNRVASYSYVQIFTANVITGNITNNRRINIETQEPTVYATAGTANVNGNMNPDGTSGHPFPTLDEACLMVTYGNIPRLVLAGTFSHQLLVLDTAVMVYSGTGTAVVAGFNFRYASGVYIYGVNFITDYTVASGTINPCSHTMVTMNQCAINTSYSGANSGNTSGHNSIYRSQFLFRINSYTNIQNTSFTMANSIVMFNYDISAITISESNTVHIALN